MIFVTLGSQKFQFDRLLKKLDELIEKEVITEQIFAQTGYSNYVPKNFNYKNFMNRTEFHEMIEQCTTVISHGGTGAIIGAVKKGKKVIAIPRKVEYGEHVDNHQMQIVKQFDEMNIICACYELVDLESVYEWSKKISLRPYESSTHRIINKIEEYLSI